MQALAAARADGTKALELRAATRLARLYRAQALNEKARDLLSPVYAWFTEGFETSDLQDAKAMLDTVS